MADSVALTPEEQRRLRPLFGQYDLEDSNIVLGERVRPLLEKSGLPPAQLGQIWQIVDVENRGFLDFYGFAKCMRLIAHAQQGLALSPKMANIPSSMPDFTKPPASQPDAGAASAAGQKQAQVPPPPQHRAQSSQPALSSFSTGGSVMSANGETRIPPLTTVDKKRFGALFDRSVNPADGGFIDGAVARDIFLKARLPEETLGKIWSLVDIEGRGKLTKNEFVVAMHLIQSIITKAMPSPPSALPSSWHPWLGSGQGAHGRSPSVQSPQLQPAQLQSPQTTAQALPTISQSPSQSHAATQAAAQLAAARPAAASTAGPISVAIAPNERAQYDAIFDSLDTSHSGILGPNEAVPLLTKSGLSEDVLAKVWDLADTRSRGQLDRGDFALAMHFVKAKLNGYELPEHVSPGAGAAAASPQPQPQSPQHTQAAAAPAAQNPKPVHRAATQVTASSLTDLVSLDNAVFKPLQPAKPRRAATEVDEKKFVPTTSFGQQLLQKQQQQQQQSQSQQSQPQQSQPQPATQPAVQPAPTASSTNQAVPEVTSSSIQAQTRDVQQLESQVVGVKADAARANDELASVLKEKADLDNKLKQLRETYDSGTKQVHETQQSIRRAREEIKQLEKDIALRTSGLEAIKTQHAQELQTHESLLSKKKELEAQHAAAETELTTLTKEAESYSGEHATHQKAIQEHESLLERLQRDIEASRWKKQQMEEAIQGHRARAAEAKQAAEERAKLAQQEAAAAAESEAKARAEAEIAAKQIAEAQAQSEAAAASAAAVQAKGVQSNAASTGTHVNASVPTTVDHAKTPVLDSLPAHGSTASSSAALSSLARDSQPQSADDQTQQHLQSQHINSLGSGSESAAESVPLAGGSDTPRTSPPTSEANYGAIDSSMPTFTLPMGRPHSATSSVVNNAPQSVRGDLGSEHSERQSPEFLPVASDLPSVPTPGLELAHQNDSFEFVDAQQSSDDEEGPEDAIPRRYGPLSPNPNGNAQPEAEASSKQPNSDETPPMPGAFPKEYEQPLSNVMGSEQPQPAPAADGDASTRAPLPPQLLPAVQKAPHGVQLRDIPVEVPNHETHAPSQPSASAPAPAQNAAAPVAVAEPRNTAQPTSVAPAASTADDFDEFDDLEEAREDESDAFNSSYNSPPPQEATGPDEWQQLFAGSNAQQLTTPSQADPFAVMSAPAPQQQQIHSESREVAELTSMGFTVDEARAALELHGHNLSEATNYLLDRMQ